MRTRLLVLMAVLLLGLVSAVSVASAALGVTFNAPGTGKSNAISGGVNLDINVTGHNPNHANVSNVSFYYVNSTTETLIGTNFSFNLTNGWYRFYFNTAPLEDVVQYTFRVRVGNQSNTSGTSSNFDQTLVWLDNTDPVTTFGSSTPATATTQESDTVTIDTPTDNNATRCDLVFGGTTFRSVPMNSNEQCSITLSDVADGTYSYNWVGYDEIDQPSGSSRTITISHRGYVAPPAQSSTQGQASVSGGLSTKNIVLWGGGIFFLIMVVCIVVFLAMTAKSK